MRIVSLYVPIAIGLFIYYKVSANLVFGWRRLYQQGLLEELPAAAVAMLLGRVSTAAAFYRSNPTPM